MKPGSCLQWVPVVACLVVLAGCRTPLVKASPSTAPPAATASVIRADGLAGTIMAPAQIISGGAGNIISGGAGNIISSDGASIISGGAGNLRVLQAGTPLAQKPWGNVGVSLIDATGRPLTGSDGKPLRATTDASGRYTFPSGVPARGVLVVVDLGATGRLQAIAPRGRAATPVDVDLVSTLTTGYIVNRYVQSQSDPAGVLDKLSAAVAETTRTRAAEALAASGNKTPDKLDPSHIDAAVTTLRRDNPAFDQQLETVRQLLEVGSVSAAVSDGAALSAVVVPFGMAIDRLGNAYFTDQNLIRKLTQDGRVITVAGSGVYGDRDGQGAAAAFFNPQALACDASGTLYVADLSNHKVRKVSPEGRVTTLAGSGDDASLTSGRDDGPGASARFGQLAGIAVDAQGTVFVSETQPRRIRKISPEGVVSTFIADAGGGAGVFQWPAALALDPAGTLYVLDPFARTLFAVGSDAKVRTVAAGAPFESPAGLALAGSRIYVADQGQILQVASNGAVTPLAGQQALGAADGQGAAAGFRIPNGLAVDSAGNLLVADTGNRLIRRVTPAGLVTTAAGTGLVGANGKGTQALFGQISGLAASGNSLFVFDSLNQRISRVGPDGTTAALAVDAQVLVSIVGLAATPLGDLYLVDSASHHVYRWSAAGGLSTVFNSKSMGPFGVVPGPDGTFYVLDVEPVDGGQARIEQIKASGEPVTIADTGVVTPDGASLFAEFAIGPDGSFYVSDGAARVVRKIAPGARTATLLAGSGQEGDADGPGAQASFRLPQGLAVDARGRVYVSDTGAGTIRRIEADGTVSTLKITLPSNSGLAHPLIVRGSTLTYCTDKQVFTVEIP